MSDLPLWRRRNVKINRAAKLNFGLLYNVQGLRLAVGIGLLLPGGRWLINILAQAIMGHDPVGVRLFLNKR